MTAIADAAHIVAEGPVLLFDGYCNLCSESVKFILKHEKRSGDRGRALRFSSLQSDFGQEVLRAHKMDPVDLKSLVLVEGGDIATESSAALKLAGFLRQPLSLLRIFWIIPKPIRDLIYRLIARNRYRWFGKRDSCMMPTPQLRRRFIE